MENFEKVEPDLVKVVEEKYPLGEVSLYRWIISLIILNSSFFVLELFPDNKVFGILFLVGPIVSIFVLGHKAFRKLFKFPKLRDIPAVFGMTFLTLFAAVVSGIVLKRFGSVDNPIVKVISKDNFNLVVLMLLVQLVIEEIFFIVWFLFLHHKVKFKSEVLRESFAWVVSSLLFGAMHLSTYDFNIVQAIVGIGLIRFVLSSIYIRRKNLTLAYMVHFLYDILILLAVVASGNIQS